MEILSSCCEDGSRLFAAHTGQLAERRGDHGRAQRGGFCFNRRTSVHHPYSSTMSVGTWRLISLSLHWISVLTNPLPWIQEAETSRSSMEELQSHIESIKQLLRTRQSEWASEKAALRLRVEEYEAKEIDRRVRRSIALSRFGRSLVHLPCSGGGGDHESGVGGCGEKRRGIQGQCEDFGGGTKDDTVRVGGGSCRSPVRALAQPTPCIFPFSLLDRSCHAFLYVISRGTLYWVCPRGGFTQTRPLLSSSFDDVSISSHKIWCYLRAKVVDLDEEITRLQAQLDEARTLNRLVSV